MKQLFRNLFTPLAAIVAITAINGLLITTSLADEPTPEQQSGGDINKVISDCVIADGTLESCIKIASNIVDSGNGQGLLGRSLHLEKEQDVKKQKEGDTGPRKYQGTYTAPALPKDKQTGYLIGLAVFSDDGCNVAVTQTADKKTTDKQLLLNQAFKPQSLPTGAFNSPKKSFYQLPILLNPGDSVELGITYTNIVYYPSASPADIDGVMIFAFIVPVGINAVKELSFKGMPVDLIPDGKGTRVPKSTDPKTGNEIPSHIPDPIPYKAPHWVDLDKDGVATVGKQVVVGKVKDTEQNKPVTFKSGSDISLGGKLTIPVNLKIQGSNSGSLPLAIRARSAHEVKGVDILWTNTTPKQDTTGLVELSQKESTTALAEGAHVYNAEEATFAFTIFWEFWGGVSWCKIGETRHTVYVTKGSPTKTALLRPYETEFYIGCKFAQGCADATFKDDFLKKLFKYYNGRNVQRVIPSRAVQDGKAMTYWLNEKQMIFEKTGLDIWELMADGNGRCGTWAFMFMDVIRTQGYDYAEVVDYDVTADLTDAQIERAVKDLEASDKTFKYEKIINTYNAFFVKNWDLPSADVNGKVGSGQIKRGEGVAGQGNPQPKADFSDHAFLKLGSDYYDPSYGKGPWNAPDQAIWEHDALMGYGISFYDEAGNGWYWLRKQDEKDIKETRENLTKEIYKY